MCRCSAKLVPKRFRLVRECPTITLHLGDCTDRISLYAPCRDGRSQVWIRKRESCVPRHESGQDLDVPDVVGCSSVGQGEVAPAANGLPKAFADKPAFDPPRGYDRSVQVWTQCEQCRMWFAVPRQRQSARRFCSVPCSAARAKATGSMAGSNNPRWLGGVSNDNMRYRTRQAERWPERESARRLTANAIKRGDLVRQPCGSCGEQKAHAHHDDYGKPLDVRWLCRPCHTAHHTAERREAKAAAEPCNGNVPAGMFMWRGKLRAG
jgi:hypothetical protein